MRLLIAVNLVAVSVLTFSSNNMHIYTLMKSEQSE